MKIFTDTKGREWKLELDLATAKVINERLRAEKVDLLQPNTLIHRLADPFFTATVLYCIIKDQADKLGVDKNEFFCSLKGSEFSDAQDMLMEEYIDFFPNRKVKDDLRMMMRKTEEHAKKVREKMYQSMEKMDDDFGKALAEMEKEMNAQIDKAMAILGGESLNLQESQESEISDTSPSGNSPSSPTNGKLSNGTGQASSSPPSPIVPAKSKKGTSPTTSTPTPDESE